MRYLICAVLVLLSSVSHAVVNIEAMRDDLSDGLTLNLGLGGELLLGNNDAFTISPALRLDYKISDEYRALALVKYDYGESGDERFKNEGFTHLRWTYTSDRKSTKGFGYEIFTQAQYDTFKSLTLRQLNGVGFRFERSGNEFGFAYGSSVMSDYDRLKEGSEDDLVMRNSTYFSAVWKDYDPNKSKAKRGKYLASFIGYYQPRFTAPTDFRVLLSAQAERALLSNVSVLMTTNYLYDSKPPNQVSSHDFKSIVSLKLTL